MTTRIASRAHIAHLQKLSQVASYRRENHCALVSSVVVLAEVLAVRGPGAVQSILVMDDSMPTLCALHGDVMRQLVRTPMYSAPATTVRRIAGVESLSIADALLAEVSLPPLLTFSAAVSSCAGMQGWPNVFKC